MLPRPLPTTATATATASAGINSTQPLRYAAWTLSPPTTAPGSEAEGDSDSAAKGEAVQLEPFSKRVNLNGGLLPAALDHGGGSFLQAIPATADYGDVSKGIVLSPVSVTFVCYYVG